MTIHIAGSIPSSHTGSAPMRGTATARRQLAAIPDMRNTACLTPDGRDDLPRRSTGDRGGTVLIRRDQPIRPRRIRHHHSRSRHPTGPSRPIRPYGSGGSRLRRLTLCSPPWVETLRSAFYSPPPWPSPVATVSAAWTPTHPNPRVPRRPRVRRPLTRRSRLPRWRRPPPRQPRLPGLPSPPPRPPRSRRAPTRIRQIRWRTAPPGRPTPPPAQPSPAPVQARAASSPLPRWYVFEFDSGAE